MKNKTLQATEDTVRALRLIKKARESRNGFVPDQDNPACLTENMYYLCVDNETICAASYLSWNQNPILGFWEDKTECERFICENHSEINWFFTEYQE